VFNATIRNKEILNKNKEILTGSYERLRRWLKVVGRNVVHYSHKRD
jgi:hypothetical protein